MHAYDAQGQALGSEMKVSEGRVVLEVEEAGAVYPVTIDPLFSHPQKLTASDGAADDNFGDSVAISGRRAVVGAPSSSYHSGGSAYVFVRIATLWIEEHKLTASDGAAQHLFGYSVAISGNTVVVGSQHSNCVRGSVYVFN